MLKQLAQNFSIQRDRAMSQVIRAIWFLPTIPLLPPLKGVKQILAMPFAWELHFRFSPIHTFTYNV